MRQGAFDTYTAFGGYEFADAILPCDDFHVDYASTLSDDLGLRCCSL
jgi:hypothetical protein